MGLQILQLDAWKFVAQVVPERHAMRKLTVPSLHMLSQGACWMMTWSCCPSFGGLTVAQANFLPQRSFLTLPAHCLGVSSSSMHLYTLAL